jgi:hypothetical protein
MSTAQSGSANSIFTFGAGAANLHFEDASC